MDKLLFRRILMIALSVLAVVYAAYLLISTNFKMYPTENAVQTTVTDKIYSNVFIILRVCFHIQCMTVMR